jgi:hypothetical protein
MKHPTSSDNELKDIAPTLAGLSRENPFTVPDHYFDTLHASIQDRISAENQPPAWVVWLAALTQPRVSVSLAAACVVLLFVVNNISDNSRTTQPVVALNEVTLDDLDVSGYLDAIGESEVVESYLTSGAGTADPVTDEQKALENYLLENNIDLSSLINEL